MIAGVDDRGQACSTAGSPGVRGLGAWAIAKVEESPLKVQLDENTSCWPSPASIFP